MYLGFYFFFNFYIGCIHLFVCISFSQSWMESDILSFSICGAHLNRYRAGRDEVEALSFRAHTETQPGLSELCTILIFKGC